MADNLPTILHHGTLARSRRLLSSTAPNRARPCRRRVRRPDANASDHHKRSAPAPSSSRVRRRPENAGRFCWMDRRPAGSSASPDLSIGDVAKQAASGLRQGILDAAWRRNRCRTASTPNQADPEADTGPSRKLLSTPMDQGMERPEMVDSQTRTRHYSSARRSAQELSDQQPVLAWRACRRADRRRRRVCSRGCIAGTRPGLHQARQEGHARFRPSIAP